MRKRERERSKTSFKGRERGAVLESERETVLDEGNSGAIIDQNTV